jgi:hypothetical protein
MGGQRSRSSSEGRSQKKPIKMEIQSALELFKKAFVIVTMLFEKDLCEMDPNDRKHFAAMLMVKLFSRDHSSGFSGKPLTNFRRIIHQMDASDLQNLTPEEVKQILKPLTPQIEQLITLAQNSSGDSTAFIMVVTVLALYLIREHFNPGWDDL